MHGCIFWVGRRVGWGGGGGGLASVERVKGVRFEDGCFWRKVVLSRKKRVERETNLYTTRRHDLLTVELQYRATVYSTLYAFSPCLP